MRGIWTAAAVIGLMAGALPACAGTGAPVGAGDRTAERKAHIERASQFLDKAERGLTQPANMLYLKALKGSAEDKWVYALALIAERYSLDAMPAAQREIYNDFARRGVIAKQAYAEAHPDEDISEKALDVFLTPTPEELQALRLGNSINNADDWFIRAGRERNGVALAIDPVVLDQSRQCLQGIKKSIDDDQMADQLMIAIMMAGDDKTESEKAEGLKRVRLQVAQNPREKTEVERDQEALCGGEQAFAHIKILMKTVYESDIRVTITVEPPKP